MPGIDAALLPGADRGKALQHPHGPALALVVQAGDGFRDSGIPHRGGLVFRAETLFQELIGQHNVLPQHILPATHLPHRRGIVGAERPLGHQSGAITALESLHRRNTQQIIVVLHGGSQRGPGIFYKAVQIKKARRRRAGYPCDGA